MEIFKILNAFNGHGLHFVYDRTSHLRAVIAIDSIVEGRAIGGIRTMYYASEEEAVEEACRLARTMSFKAALADLPTGGAKCVIYAHPNLDRPAAFRALARAIDALRGLYHCGADIGTTLEDLQTMRALTQHVSHHLAFGKHTARGVLLAMEAASQHAGGSDSLEGLTIAIQGLGEVGMQLADMLHQKGCQLVVADTDERRAQMAAEAFGASVTDAAGIIFEPCDILAPCSIGGQITPEVIPSLSSRIICGSANNVLADASLAADLRGQGVLFVPDVVSSAGALIVGVNDLIHGRRASNEARLAGIFDTTLNVLKLADEGCMSTVAAAETLAARQLEARSAR